MRGVAWRNGSNLCVMIAPLSDETRSEGSMLAGVRPRCVRRSVGTRLLAKSQKTYFVKSGVFTSEIHRTLYHRNLRKILCSWSLGMKGSTFGYIIK